MSDLFPYEISDNVRQKAAQIKLLVLDVDGVLTGGNLYFAAGGETLKEFSILDGLGIKLLRQAGVESAIITGRLSGMVSKRMQELGVTHVIQGREDKLVALRELAANIGLPLDAIAYVGDDLPDLSAVRAAQFGAAPANAHDSVKHFADWVCFHAGGNGAVREVADIILESKGLYNSVINSFQ